MKKKLALAMLALSLSSGLWAEAKLLFQLDASSSTLVASAMKNETKTVKVMFPSLSGSLDLATGKASVTTELSGLQTGDPWRDSNIKQLFFNITMKASFGQASFSWTGKPAELAGLKTDKPQSTVLKGELNLHGTKTVLSGPAVLTLLADGSYKASFSDWIVDIKQVQMASSLAKLNKYCPKPHRVANEVKLSGDLVFRQK